MSSRNSNEVTSGNKGLGYVGSRLEMRWRPGFRRAGEARQPPPQLQTSSRGQAANTKVFSCFGRVVRGKTQRRGLAPSNLVILIRVLRKPGAIYSQSLENLGDKLTTNAWTLPICYRRLVIEPSSVHHLTSPVCRRELHFRFQCGAAENV